MNFLGFLGPAIFKNTWCKTVFPITLRVPRDSLKIIFKNFCCMFKKCPCNSKIQIVCERFRRCNLLRYQLMAILLFGQKLSIKRLGPKQKSIMENNKDDIIYFMYCTFYTYFSRSNDGIRDTQYPCLSIHKKV